MNVRTGIICGLLSLTLCGCGRESDALPELRREEVPVRFTAERPHDDASTRAITDKEMFKAGDAIHVSAVFSLDDGSTVTKYAPVTLDEYGQWHNKTVLDMGWPWNATSAEFTAYYLENWDGPIASLENPVDPVVLDRFESQGRHINPDPLKAVTKVDGYGRAVHLRFEHLCTRLTIEDVGNEKEYWIRDKKSSGSQQSSFINACQLARNGDNTLTFEFVPEQSGKVSSQTFDAVDGTRAVTFHLAPGDYSRFSLTLHNGYSYLLVTDVDELRELLPNKAYTVSLNELQGNITPDDEEEWVDGVPEVPTVPEYSDFDVSAFLKAIHDCREDYVCKLDDGSTVTVLKCDPLRNEMLLMHNIDLEGRPFAAVDLPNIVTFDGGKHSILNVAHPMFNTIYGTVKHLNLYAVDEPVKVVDGMTDWGMLARISERGEIGDIRLNGVAVEFTVPDHADVKGKTCNVGALVGWVRSGNLYDITLTGDISVTVDSEYEGDYIVFAGGVTGQCSGAMDHVDNFGGNSVIRVTNRCKGLSSRYTGGLAGAFNEAVMHHCNVVAEVDASASTGTWNYTGGVAGAVRTTTGGAGIAAISDIIVTGSVSGGHIDSSVSETTNHSSTGGIVGHVQGASVTGGVAMNRVSVAIYDISKDLAHYTVGGVIGSMANVQTIRKNEGHVPFDADAYNNRAGYVAGTFCGGGGSTDELMRDGNTAVGQGRFVGSDK